MPKIKETKNRIIVHVGDLHKKYKTGSKDFIFRIHDTGRKGFTQRIACKYRGKWETFGWSFEKNQVKKEKRTLKVYDNKALKLLNSLKKEGDLVGYKVVDYVNK